MINTVALFGRMTADAEMRASAKGFAIAKFCLAVNERKRDNEEITHFIDCTAFGKTAEIIRDYLGKGHPVMLQGRLNQDVWESKEGGKKSKLGVIVETLQLVPRPKGSEDSPQNAKNNAKPSSPIKSNSKRKNDFDSAMDGEMPF